jgi:hypothetical protein
VLDDLISHPIDSLEKSVLDRSHNPVPPLNGVLQTEVEFGELSRTKLDLVDYDALAVPELNNCERPNRLAVGTGESDWSAGSLDVL